mmetsp:Transcript_82665/g.149121  ORF Transcript_82665/g.149121 Transcript_82665/m.149121 type:complete len:237 (-) Transcript_82665:147-857(-)
MDDFLDLHAHVHGDAKSLDLLRKDRASGLVQLGGHQVGGHLQDVALHLQVVHCLGCLQPQQPATDHHRASGPGLGRSEQTFQVLDGAVDEHAFRPGGWVIWPVHVLLLRQRHPWNWRHEAEAARGQNQHVVADAGRAFFTLAKHGIGHRPCFTIDGNCSAIDELHRQFLEFSFANVRQLHGVVLVRILVLEVLGQHHAVVGGPGLLTEHGDLKVRMPLHQLLDEGVANRPMADHEH